MLMYMNTPEGVTVNKRGLEYPTTFEPGEKEETER